jgi:hypothetical protein
VAQLAVLAAPERIHPALGVENHRMSPRRTHPLNLYLECARNVRVRCVRCACDVCRVCVCVCVCVVGLVSAMEGDGLWSVAAYLVEGLDEGRFVQLVNTLAQSELSVLSAADHKDLALAERPAQKVVLTQRPPPPVPNTTTTSGTPLDFIL